MAAFFAGYFCSQIPWGIIVQRFGGKKTVGFGLLVCGILSIVTPAAAEYSFVLTVIVRGLIGVTQVMYNVLFAYFFFFSCLDRNVS